MSANNIYPSKLVLTHTKTACDESANEKLENSNGDNKMIRIFFKITSDYGYPGYSDTNLTIII